MSRVRRWVSTLQPSYLFALPVMLGVAAEFILGQLTSPYSLRAPILLNLTSYLIAVVGTFIVLGAVYALLRRFIADDDLRVVLLIATPIAAALGGGLMGWVRYVIGQMRGRRLGPLPAAAVTGACFTPSTRRAWQT